MTVSVRLHSKSHRQISKCQNFPRVWHLVIFRADQSKKHPLQLFGCSKTSSSLWLAMTLIGALPSVYSALKASTKREGPSNIVKAQEISPTFWFFYWSAGVSILQPGVFYLQKMMNFIKPGVFYLQKMMNFMKLPRSSQYWRHTASHHLYWVF